MKAAIIFSLLFTFSIIAKAQQIVYDTALAKKLQADEYGMKTYVLVILKSGTAKVSKPVDDSIFAGHMKNIDKLAAEGKLVVAGPLGKNDFNYRGIFILNTKSIEEAKSFVNTDPAVSNNLLGAEYMIWYGSAALQEIAAIHKTIQKTPF